MPKLYISPGLSERVHLALTRRLESFMAGAYGTAIPAEMGRGENPAVPGAHCEAVSEPGEHVHQDEQSKSPVRDSKEDEERGGSRSPRPRFEVPEPNQRARLKYYLPVHPWQWGYILW